jgi:hypothetical protein
MSDTFENSLKKLSETIKLNFKNEFGKEFSSQIDRISNFDWSNLIPRLSDESRLQLGQQFQEFILVVKNPEEIDEEIEKCCISLAQDILQLIRRISTINSNESSTLIPKVNQNQIVPIYSNQNAKKHTTQEIDSKIDEFEELKLLIEEDYAASKQRNDRPHRINHF